MNLPERIACPLRPAVLFLTLIALAWGSSPALASIPTSPLIHVDWDGCTPGSASNRDFACNVESGTDILAASYTAEALADQPPSQFTFRISFNSGYPEPPSWWQTYPAGCRAGAMTLDEVLPSSGTCLHFPSQLFYSFQQASAGGVRLTGGILLTQPTIPEPLIAGQTYFLFNMNIAHTKSVGTDSCSGCGQPLSIFFEEFKIYTTTLGLEYTYDGFVTPKATWQWSQVPTRNVTWGRIKSLYP